MPDIRVTLLLLGLLCCHASRAQTSPAPYTNLRVIPDPAIAGQPIAARLFSGGCATIPIAEVITVQGNVVTLTHDVDEICGVPLPGGDSDFPIGAFPAGQYTLIYAPTSGSGNIYAPQSVQFVVLAPNIAIPVSSKVAVAMLALALLGVGVWHATKPEGRP